MEDAQYRKNCEAIGYEAGVNCNVDMRIMPSRGYAAQLAASSQEPVGLWRLPLYLFDAHTVAFQRVFDKKPYQVAWDRYIGAVDAIAILLDAPDLRDGRISEPLAYQMLVGLTTTLDTVRERVADNMEASAA